MHSRVVATKEAIHTNVETLASRTKNRAAEAAQK
jgi:hypothetical protein